MPAEIEASNFINELSTEVRRDFKEKKTVLSFEEYLRLLLEAPKVHIRNSAQYIKDCFNHFGIKNDRFLLFNKAFNNHKNALIGQEETQWAFYKVIQGFVRQGKIDRLILVHGPNGSAKTTFVQAIQDAMEYYCRTPEGAMYTFNWIFPVESVKKTLGFTGVKPNIRTKEVNTYAYLEDSEIVAKISCGLKDHPIFLIPKEHRKRLLEDIARKNPDINIPEVFFEGDLSHLSRQIFDALLTNYQGDINKVFAHVQVERFFLSRRYRQGIVTVEPQIQVDAGVRQITMNRAFESLPKILQNISLFEPYGDLVDGNRGMIEYNDLLKRPVDAYKYLLATSEKGTVSLPTTILHLDTVFVATSNDVYLKALMEHPDWSSFKGRFELIRMPYLLDYKKEEAVYRMKVESAPLQKQVAPYTYLFAAMFAVASRMIPIDTAEFSEEDKKLVSRLNPWEKADLYSEGPLPAWAGLNLGKRLTALIPAIKQAGQDSEPYEGATGPSPRQMMAKLRDCIHKKKYKCVSPNALFTELKEMLKRKDLYTFLRIEPQGNFFNYNRILEALYERYLNYLDKDLKRALRLEAAGSLQELFSRYVEHLSRLNTKEKVKDPITGELVPPDENFVGKIEEKMGVSKGQSQEVRSEILSRIGAWSLDHPDAPIDYKQLFPELIEALSKQFYEERRNVVAKKGRWLLNYLAGEEEKLSSKEMEEVKEAADVFINTLGYKGECAVEAVALVLKERYLEV